MGFCRQEYWSGLPCPPPGDLPDPEIKLMCLAPPALQADSLPPGHQGYTKYTVTKNNFRVGCVPSTEGRFFFFFFFFAVRFALFIYLLIYLFVVNFVIH